MDTEINSSCISEEDLKLATQICTAQALRPLSESHPTYVHLIAQSHGHCAAVQLKLTPFKPPQFREQTLFYPHYRYTNCCQEISFDFRICVETKVQTILRAFYQIGRWNLSDQACYTRDSRSSPPANRATCFSIAQSCLSNYYAISVHQTSARCPRLDVCQAGSPSRPEVKRGTLRGVLTARQKTYINHSYPTSGLSHTQIPGRKRLKTNSYIPSSAILDGNLDNETAEELSMPRTTANSLQDNYNSTQLEEVLESEQEDTLVHKLDGNYGSIQSESPPVSEVGQEDMEIVLQSGHENTPVDNVDQELVNNLATDVYDKITKGIKIIRSQLPAFPADEVGAQPYKGRELVIDEAEPGERERRLVIHGAPQLLRQAKAVAVLGLSRSWYLSFVAGAAWEYYSRRTIVAIPEWDKKTTATLNAWATIVQVVNGIVTGLHSTWGCKAYLVYNALAAKNFTFHAIKRTTKKNREQIIAKIVHDLKDSKPKDIKVPSFDPVPQLRLLLSIDDQVIRLALSLPSIQETSNTQSVLQPPTEDLALAIETPEVEPCGPTMLSHAPVLSGEVQDLNNMNSSTYTMRTTTEDGVSFDGGSGIADPPRELVGPWSQPLYPDNTWTRFENAWGEPVLPRNVTWNPWPASEATIGAAMYDTALVDEASMNLSGGCFDSSFLPYPQAR